MSVYFLRCVENGLIKIGWTERPVRARMAAIASLSTEPFTIEVLALIDGDATDERVLHKRFAVERAHPDLFYAFGHECFHPSEELLGAIAALPRDEDVGLTYRANKRPPFVGQRQCSHCRSPKHMRPKCSKWHRANDAAYAAYQASLVVPSPTSMSLAS